GSATATSPTSATTAPPTVGQEHAVPAPGPRGPGILAPADLLVVGANTLDPAIVDQVKALDGVTLLQLSLAEPIVENEARTVAAVDPGAYRSFTPPRFADFEEAWDRVAAGELALKQRLKGKLSTDPDGYLRLGGAADAPAVHVGAYVQQQPLIDVVVNQTWAETLGMPQDNALLVRTGARAPATVAKEVRTLFGGTAAVTLVDKATRIGLQPGAKLIAVVTGTVADAVGVFRYTVLGGGRIAPDPAWVRDHISTEVVPILGAVTCNKLIFPQLRAALEDIQDQGLADKIHPDQFAGCYYPRFIAGTSTLSNHAFGLALDINAVENQRGTVGLIDRGVVRVFQKWGFTWGGDWNYTDPMHFEMNTLVTPKPEGADD
ncbi:MAG TPA: M15 family metallopeptidase, partial [Nocardioides sp.]|nr:M15 family metallopeptidase [Nocardioides sp.]